MKTNSKKERKNSTEILNQRYKKRMDEEKKAKRFADTLKNDFPFYHYIMVNP